jgi:hypothetical protein
MPGPPPEHPNLRLLKGNAGKHPTRSPPEPARAEECPLPPEHLSGHAREAWLDLRPSCTDSTCSLFSTSGRSAPTAVRMPIGNRPKRRCSARAS